MARNGGEQEFSRQAQADGDFPASLVIGEVQLLLAEKRTALSVMRTAIAVFAVPLSIFSVLIATSRLYTLSHVLYWIVPVALLSGGLVFLGIYLLGRSLHRIKELDERIRLLKQRLPELTDTGEQ